MVTETLSLKATAIGSLPYKNSNEAIDFIFDTYEIPFWPQLAKINRLEDMIFQYTQNMCGILYSEKNEKFIFDTENEDFYTKLEEFYIDYEEIVENNNKELLEKYAITEPYSSAIDIFKNKLSLSKPKFAKGQITGPFTWGVSLTDKDNKCAFYDDIQRDIVIKTAVLKALWQINMIKTASADTIPIIFMDEPAMSQSGTSTFVTIKKEEIIEALSYVAKIIKKNGALCAIHCCGKCDWDMVIDSDVNILNFDAFNYSKSLGLFANKVDKFLKKGNFLAWGIVPTLDKDALAKTNIDELENKFEEGIKYLTDKNIDRNLILKQSFFTPSCGAGTLDMELAQKAMFLTREFSDKMREKYSEI